MLRPYKSDLIHRAEFSMERHGGDTVVVQENPKV
jgi:hypothetical protein